jgi:hypothetical protein
MLVLLRELLPAMPRAQTKVEKDFLCTTQNHSYVLEIYFISVQKMKLMSRIMT